MDVIEVDSDTCDQCGPNVHAYVYAEFSTGTLALCGHCATVGWERLNQQAVKVIDLRHLIGP